MITRKDKMFIIILLIICLLFFALQFIKKTGTYAVVKQNGETVLTFSLTDEDFETQVNGVTVCLENGSVYVKNSDCPDKVCVRSGKLKKSGDCAICVPNGISVEISGEKKNSPDAITG